MSWDFTAQHSATGSRVRRSKCRVDGRRKAERVYRLNEEQNKCGRLNLNNLYTFVNDAYLGGIGGMMQ